MTDLLEIVPAVPADAPLVESWMRDFYAEGRLAMGPANLRAMRTLLETPDLGCILIAKRAGKPAGYCVLTYGFSLERGGRFALIDELFISPDARGGGVGRAMLDAAIQKARGARCGAACLEVDRVNARAFALYRRAGFVAHDRDFLTLTFV